MSEDLCSSHLTNSKPDPLIVSHKFRNYYLIYMNKHSTYSSLMPLNQICIFFIIILSLKQTSGVHYQYETCRPTSCGRGPNISFPFLIRGRQESYCGYPGFELNCNQDGFAVLQMAQDDYVIQGIFYENQSLRVYDAAISHWDNGTSCFSQITNTTLATSQLYNYVSSRDLHLFSNCTERLPEELLRYRVRCGGGDDSNNNWALALYDNDENLRNVAQVCERNVVVPVEGYDGKGNIGNATNLLEVLRRGFVMNWTASDCNTCESSGGRCGFDDRNYHFRCFCRDRPHSRSCIPGNVTVKHTILIGGVTAGAVATAITLLIFLTVHKKKQRVLLRLLGLRKAETQQEIIVETFLRNHGNLAQKRYKYSDLKKITNSFKDTLGKGGYGSVYKGKLPNGRSVAVKILNESKGNGEEFINEVASISRTSHVNIVTLLGFCFEGSKRALIYEFMPNGSLDRFLLGENSTGICSSLKWKKLFEIAVGIARGLEYLHKGCTTRILHFDIKPQNILLDENLNPKISDFGLARLCPNRSSIVSMLGARGTIGYIAPEVFCRNYGEVSHKADVYSYGMMVLEMVVGRQPNVQGDRSTDMYFPDWIYKNLEENNINVGIVNEEDHNGHFSRKMIIVGLWCIQTEPKNRPPINRVVEMLEGSVELLEIPPKPVLSSPPRLATATGVASSSAEQTSVRD